MTRARSLLLNGSMNARYGAESSTASRAQEPFGRLAANETLTGEPATVAEAST